MKRTEIEVEHRFKNRFVGRHILRPTENMIVVGSSRDADIRLLGDGINGVHAVIECNESGWTVSDMCSETGTWVKKQAIISQPVVGTTLVHISGHHLKLIPKEIEANLFQNNVNPENQHKMGKDVFQQVVIRKAGHVVQTVLVDKDENFNYMLGGKVQVFAAPKKYEWQEQTIGDVVIQQRLVNSQKIEKSTSEKMTSLWDPELKNPFIVAFVLMVLVMGLVFLAPSRPDDELAQLKPEQNKYTRILYDAKAVRKKRAEAVKQRKNIAGSQGAPAAPAKAVANQSKPSKSAAASKVVSKIKAAGLSQLIGKISKRASKTATFVQATGKNADDQMTGRSLASPGALAGAAGSNSGAAGNFKISGVSTKGVAGGTGSLNGVGGLATGNVGNSSVGIIEEETEVEGGLDRDVIARIIKTQLGQIRYCYERQLSANPELYGKVMVKFTIGNAGSVVTQNVGLTTLNNAMVEGCILRRVAGWKFPEPRGGTSVLVTYPFLFKSSN